MNKYNLNIDSREDYFKIYWYDYEMFDASPKEYDVQDEFYFYLPTKKRLEEINWNDWY